MVNGTKDPVGPHLCAQRIPFFTLHSHQAPQYTRCWRSRRSSSDSRSCGEKTGSSAWKNRRTFAGMSGTAAANRSASCSEFSRDSADVANPAPRQSAVCPDTCRLFRTDDQPAAVRAHKAPPSCANLSPCQSVSLTLRRRSAARSGRP